MLKFVTDVSQDEYDTFVQSSKYCNLLQSYNWAKIKTTWDHLYTGVYDDDKLVATGLVLIKRLPLSFTMFYIPRGPILDYFDKDLLTYYFKELKKVAKKQHCLFIKIDPAIHLRDFPYSSRDNQPEMNKDALTIKSHIEMIGGKHYGYTKFIRETVQPRFFMGLPKMDDLDKHLPKDTYKSKLTAERRHVKVRTAGKEELPEFAKLMEMTENRKSVNLRSLDYFQQIMDTYPDNSYLFLAHVDPTERAKELENDINDINEKLNGENVGRRTRKKLQQQLNPLVKELDSMKDVLEKYHEDTIVAGGLMIGYGKEAEMLYAGMNEDFRSFRPQYLTYCYKFNYCYDLGYEYVTMGGVEGSLHDGLSVYKSNFNPIVTEYLGEFDIPVNKLLFHLFQTAYKIRKKKNSST